MPGSEKLITDLLAQGLRGLTDWRSGWPDFEQDETLSVDPDKAREVIAQLVDRLQHNYPFFHPAYAGQMLKPPHAVASIAYFLAQQINPNNHALDGGPATARMEQEAVAELARMFGLSSFLGHLTSSGTIANLEALWVARSLHPAKAIAFSTEAHYTHSRMCEVIGARAVELAVDDRGRMDLEDLRNHLKTGKIGTVVATAGTTALGAIDPIDQLVELRSEFEFRIHIDAAYGGFFRLLAETGELQPEDARSFESVMHCDSVVIDPHKHGLQPYGCGSVIFSDPTVGRFYRHDSPYTYFTSGDLHLGEISLECSRAGAAAAALWATLQLFPLKSESGLGSILKKTRRAALAWSQLLESSREFELVLRPSLDIVAYYGLTAGNRVSEISGLTHRIFDGAMNAGRDSLYLAKLALKPRLLESHRNLLWDEPSMTTFRSVLMKPEHLNHVPTLHAQLTSLL
jgi:glutamate/tyrosine decarboxylase-like PLP-dependent enzyme